MRLINIFRFWIFWIWVVTLIVTLSVFIGTLVAHKMVFKEIEDSLTQVMGLLVPQISVMTAFFFGASKQTQAQLLAQNQALGAFALGLSAVYHVSFWIVMSLAIGLGIFGSTIDENTNAAIKILGFLSIFGLSPVAYLFASGTSRKA
jgi:hypothetical protein